MDESRDNAVARQLLQDLVTARLPACGRFRLAAHCERPANSGGDFYQARALDQGALLLMMAEVMAKGMPAALLAAAVSALWVATIQAEPALARQPAALLGFLNQQLFVSVAEVELFVSMQIALVDVAHRELVAASAGHSPVLLVSRHHSPVTLPRPAGLPLGMFRHSEYREQRAALPDAARLLLFSDGLADCLNARGETLGTERLEHWLAEGGCHCPTAEQLKDRLSTESRRFMGSASPLDDRVFLLLVEEAAATELAIA